VTGSVLLALMPLVVLSEWAGAALWGLAASTGAAIALVTMAPRVGPGRQVFLLIGAALIGTAIAIRGDWVALTGTALGHAAFIAAFFTAQAALRSAAAGSAAIAECGRFVADQPPGRRYAALTLGGQLFGLILGYGAISLLGGLAEASARHEANPELRGHRLRRMLLAIQRGFVSTLPWSPLAFAVAITTEVVPGATWGNSVLPCLVSGLLLAGLGWALDTIFKPRLSPGVTPRRAAPDRPWLTALRPLLVLLGVIVCSVIAVALLSGLRIIVAVMLIVPLIALTWVALQHKGPVRATRALQRAAAYATRELPAYRSELVLLMMAGFIGSLGGQLAAPFAAATELDFGLLPLWALHLLLFWTVPVAGQLGMNPILVVSLIAPILPAPAEIGASPVSLIVALTGGWALSAATSPFTATTLLIGSIGKVGAVHVGLRWNGLYVLVCGVALSIWTLLVMQLW
jgi:hypothetical protein